MNLLKKTTKIINNKMLRRYGLLILVVISTTIYFLLKPDMQLAKNKQEISRLILENGLEVMLISDKRFSDSAASLTVEAGSLHNHKDHQGLAHFLEHMLFLGTEKYPASNDYFKYISENGGSANAYTRPDYTGYYFSVLPQSLEGGLDRFSQFFIAPLLPEKYTKREMNAVNSEHAKNTRLDYWRAYHLSHSFYTEGDPRSGFYTGNLETLKNVTPAILRDFLLNYYSADKMHLAISGPQPLEKLEELTRLYFSQIESRPTTKLNLSTYPTEAKQALQLIKLRSIQDNPELNINFKLDKFNEYYREDPLSVVSFVLGHEGEGSLLSLLKEDGLALGLSAYGATNQNGGSELDISIRLTPKGVKQYQAVLQKTMGTLNALKKSPPPKWLLEQNVQLSQMSSDFDGETIAIKSAALAASYMVSIPLKDLPRALYGATKADPKPLYKLLDELSPQRMLVLLSDRNLKTDKIEPYYNAPYSYQEITGTTYQNLVNAQPDPRWKLPEPNNFIAKNTTLLKLSAAPYISDDIILRAKAVDSAPEVLEVLAQLKGTSFSSFQEFQASLKKQLPNSSASLITTITQLASPKPTLLLKTPFVQAWHVEDWLARTPVSSAVIQFALPNHGKDRRSQALSELYADSVIESLNEIGYPLRIAKINYNLSYSRNGLNLNLNGASDRMPEALELIISHIKNPDISVARFDSIKLKQQQEWLNSPSNTPYRQASDFIKPLLLPIFHYPVHLAKVSEQITLADIQAFSQQLFLSFKLNAVFAGNISPSDAKQMLSLFPSPQTEIPPDRPTARLISPSKPLQFQYQVENNNALAISYYQISPNIPKLKAEATSKISSSTLHENFFNQIRTEKQLGYAVFAGNYSIFEVPAFRTLVQSDSYSAQFIQNRVQEFIPTFISEIKEISKDEFDKLKASTLSKESQLPKSISSLAKRTFKNIFVYENIKYQQELVQNIQSLSKDEFNSILEQTLQSEKRILQIQLLPEGKPLTIKNNVELP